MGYLKMQKFDFHQEKKRNVSRAIINYKNSCKKSGPQEKIYYQNRILK
jgi:hypothetical protein